MDYCFAESGNDTKRKKQPAGMTNYGTGANKMKQGKVGQMIKSSGYVSASTPKENTPRGAKEVSEIHLEVLSLVLVVADSLSVTMQAEISSNTTYHDCMQVEYSFTEGGLPSKLKTKPMVDANDIILVKKKNVLGKDGFKVSLEHDRDICIISLYSAGNH